MWKGQPFRGRHGGGTSPSAGSGGALLPAAAETLAWGGDGGKGRAPLLQLQKCLWVVDTDAAESLQGKNQFTVEKSPEKPGAHSSSARQGMNHWPMLRDGSGVLGNWPSWDGATGHRTLGLSLSCDLEASLYGSGPFYSL